MNKAHQANLLYPNAISMIDSVRMYEQTCKKVDDRERVSESPPLINMHDQIGL